jgi:hypothetical protein
MQIKDESFGYKKLTDSSWTKRETLENLDPHQLHRFTNQFQAGIILCVRSEKSLELAKKWVDKCSESNYKLLCGPSRDSIEDEEFQDHRYEQSILSPLYKEFGLSGLADETYFFPNWDLGKEFPIWAMRNRTGGDAFRRNFLDLLKISLGRLERRLKFSQWLILWSKSL